MFRAIIFSSMSVSFHSRIFHLDAFALRYFCDRVFDPSKIAAGSARGWTSARRGARLSLFSRSGYYIFASLSTNPTQSRAIDLGLVSYSDVRVSRHSCRSAGRFGPHIAVRLVRSRGGDSRGLEVPCHGCLLTCCSPSGDVRPKWEFSVGSHLVFGTTRFELFY